MVELFWAFIGFATPVMASIAAKPFGAKAKERDATSVKVECKDDRIHVVYGV